ncbi:hypothetical protein ACA910_012080 [Epithemia clementina (nom. ined.)]
MRSRKFAELILLLSTWFGTAPTSVLSEATRNSLSSSSLSTTTTTKWERIPLVRRLYGEENAEVRKNMAALEESMYRFRTGLAPDPDHVVPYDYHPYNKMNDKTPHRRRLNEEEPTDLFRHIRIHFETAALDAIKTSDNQAKIEWFENVVLPKTRDFWQNALSVVPVSGYLKISSYDLNQGAYCGDQEFTKVGNEYINTGLPDTDLILFVSGSASTQFCAAQTLAVAVACNFDQFDRPTAGAINVCLDNIELNDDGTASDAVLGDYVDVSIHEVGHVLGMSSNSYRFFYDPATGKPRTGRPFISRTVTCVDGTQRSQILPGESTMVFGTRQDGTRYASIVTEKVSQIARNQFDCSTLEGASLENQPTRSDSCTGDHWDERLFYPEAMTGVISPTTNILSSLTLALMEDSGWYKANYTVSEMSPWGLAAGCDFVEQQCLTRVSGGNPTIPSYSRGYFCADEEDKGCAPTHTHKMACQVINYLYVVGEEVPQQKQYFAVSSLGGSKQTDYCPVYGNTYYNKKADALDCRIASNTPSFPNSYSEVYGSSSKCLVSSSGEGRCYESVCVKEDMTFRFNVVGRWYTCEYDFQEKEIPITDGTVPHTVTCPRLAQVCPDLFCPFNCAGRGVCDYTNQVNGTLQPVCKCFDSTDTSPACSDSLIPDGGFLDDAGTLIDNLQENFFDPLVSVFVDHPDDWDTASWAWAIGLLTVGIILILCVCSSMCPSPSRKGHKVKSGAIARSRPASHAVPRSRPPTRSSAPPTATNHHHGRRESTSSRLYNI